MLSMIKSASLNGMEAGSVTVETEISRGLPSVSIIGLGDATVKEAGARIRSAITSSKLEYPNGRITINLSPAWLRKKGSHYDLAMAVGILATSGQLRRGKLVGTAFIGELSLNGEINRCKGVMPMVKALRNAEVERVIVPLECVKEARLVDGIEILGAKHLREIVSWSNDNGALYVLHKLEKTHGNPQAVQLLDFKEIKGQESAKRAMVIAAAGNHSVLMTGSPGTGKTMMAERIPGILPELTKDEVIELTSIYSVAGLLRNDYQIVTDRPFRNPGMSLTVPGLLGNGVPPRPGEITLAHKGVLFIDELGERSRDLIDSLRIPLESKEVLITRRGETYRFPADFMLVAASNPCKCGNFGDPRKECTCTAAELQSYRTRLSGPILGRIDMHIELSSPEYTDLTVKNVVGTEEMREQIVKGRKMQERRGILNSNIEPKRINEICRMSLGAEELLKRAYDAMKMEPRGIGKVRKISRTIADLDESDVIEEKHLTEALQFRERILRR